MKKCIFFVILFSCAGLSCKKGNSGGGSYHLTATINGKNETFNVSPIATRISIGGNTYISIGGLAIQSPTGEMLQLGLSTHPGGAAIKAGTYMDTTTQFDVTGLYSVKLGEAYEGGSSIYQSSLGGASAPIRNHFRLVISSIDSSSIRGTFSGDCFYAASTDSAVKTITNGDFFVKIH